MEKLSLGQALRLIAERTAFRTEDESRAVLACIDEHIAEDEREQADAARLAEQYRAEQDEKNDDDGKSNDDDGKAPNDDDGKANGPGSSSTPARAAKSTGTAVKTGRGR